MKVLTLLIIFVLTLFADCQGVWPSVLSIHDKDGKIYYRTTDGSQTKISNGSYKLITPTLDDGSSKACGTCTYNGFTPTCNNNNATDVCEQNKTTSSTIDTSSKFNGSPNIVYEVKQSKTYSGDAYNQFISDGKTHVWYFSGDVLLNQDNWNWTQDSNTPWKPGKAQELIIIHTGGTFSIKGGSKVSAMIYSDGSVVMGSDVKFNGAISAKNISIEGQSGTMFISYDALAVSEIDYAVCTSPVAPPPTPVPLPASVAFDAWDSHIVASPPALAARKLYTQISSNPFTVKAASFDTGSTSYQPFTSSKIKARVVKSSDCANANATSLSGSWQDIDFTSLPVNINFTVANAAQDVRVQFAFQDLSKIFCSTDNFAVRPKNLDFNLSSPPPASLLSAKNYAAISRAYTNSGVQDTGYTPSLTGKKTLITTGLTGCSALNETFTMPYLTGAGFIQDFNFSDVGNILVELNDTTWANVDSTVIPPDCIPNSASAIADASGKFGCSIYGSANTKVVPYEYNVTNGQYDAAGLKWLYVGDASKSIIMSADLIAQNMQHYVTKNFTKGCYAQTVPAQFWLKSAMPADINYSLDGSPSAIKSNVSGDINISASVIDSNFSNGKASFSLAYNLLRKSQNNPSEPMVVYGTRIESNASDANNSFLIFDNNKTIFIYGRVNPLNTTIYGTSGSAKTYVEVYASDANSLPCCYIWRESPTGHNWWVNVMDNNTSGVSISSQGSGGNAVGGQYSFNVSGQPSSKQTYHLDVPLYLWYGSSAYKSFSNGGSCSSHPCFTVEFLNTSNANSSWLGAGTTDKNAIGATPSGRRKMRSNR